MGPLDMKFLVVLGILIWLKQAIAIDCYNCGVFEDKCKDPFKTSGASTVQCSGSCYKVKAKDSNSNAQAAARGCYATSGTKDTCAEETYNGVTGTVCVCNGNLCNYALPVGSSIIVMAVSIIIFIAFH